MGNKLSLIILIFVFSQANLQAKSAHENRPFAGNKVVLSQPNVSGLRKSGGSQVTREEKLVVIVNNNCVFAGQMGRFTQEAISPLDTMSEINEQAYAWQPSRDYLVSELEDAVNRDPCVVGLTEDKPVRLVGEFTSDPLTEHQPHLQTVRADQANTLFWGSSFAINQEVKIAIVDSGIDYTHPDLVAQMWTNGSGFHGRDVYNNDDNPMDDNGHGTHVAGLAAAKSNNNTGVSGIMGDRVKLIAVKAMDEDGNGSITSVVNGIQYAVAQGAHVINLSLGGDGESAAIENALLNAVSAGSVVLIAAGNDGERITSSNFKFPIGYAASIDGVIGIGSINTAGEGRSSFSNYSETFVEIAAPGSKDAKDGLGSTYLSGDYALAYGTSMATPVAAGAAGLLIGMLQTHGQSFTPASIEEIMLRSAKKFSEQKQIFKDGNHLDLYLLSLYIQNNFLFNGSSGLEE